MNYKFSLLIACLILSFPASPQETETTFYKSDSKNNRYTAGLPLISPVVLPAYSPEMGFILTGGCLISFKTKLNNDYLTHSFFSLLIKSNLKDGNEAYANLYSFWFDDRVIIKLTGDYKKRTDHYWGVGFEQADQIDQGDNTTRYSLIYKAFTPAISVKLFNSVYAGIKADIHTTEASDLSELMLEDENILNDTNDLAVSGIGLNILYDHRNSITFPTKGIYFQIEGMNYNHYLSGKYKYQLYGFDYRHYLPFFRNGSIIAWQFKTSMGFGDIPWSELQRIGSPYDLRGYFYGQYRDKSSACALIEYRHIFASKSNTNLSRHGFVFWMGAGTVFPDINKISKILFSTGIGYRFEIQPGNNLRIDLGFAAEGTGLFVNYSEAF